jgi:hypothetical protein
VAQKIMKRAIVNNRNPRYILPVCFVFAGLVLLMLSGCAPPGVVSENDNLSVHTTQGEEDSAMKEESGFAEISRPPIDLELPDGLKTATLGMG